MPSSLEANPTDNALRQQVLSKGRRSRRTSPVRLRHWASRRRLSISRQPGAVTQVKALTQSIAQLNQRIQSLTTGSDAAAAVNDTQALSTSLNYVSQQRVTIDNSTTQLTDASNAISTEQTQLTAAQTSLMRADVAKVATQLSLSETQQTALEAVIARLGSGSLFDKL